MNMGTMSEYHEGYDQGFLDGYKNNSGDVIGLSDEYIDGYNNGWQDGFEQKQDDMKMDREY